MDTFPRIGTRVIDANRIDDAILTVESVDYATGNVTVRHTVHAAPRPYGVPGEAGTLIYRAPLANLTYA